MLFADRVVVGDHSFCDPKIGLHLIYTSSWLLVALVERLRK